jgi:hypothetical protein
MGRFLSPQRPWRSSGKPGSFLKIKQIPHIYITFGRLPPIFCVVLHSKAQGLFFGIKLAFLFPLGLQTINASSNLKKGRTMKCPKCGYERQGRDDAFVPTTECPACGIVYSKHEHIKEPDAAIGFAPPPHLRSSPVDAASLKKARERVEKRLRERLESRVRDERHTQTLQLAKRLTAEQIRIRRQEWEKSHGLTKAEDPAQEAVEASDASAPSASVAVLETDRQPVEPTVSDRADQPGEEVQAAAADLATPAESEAAPSASDPEDLAQTSLLDGLNQDAEAESPAPEWIEPIQSSAPPSDQEAVLLEDIVVISPNQIEPEPQQISVDEEAAPESEAITSPEPEPVAPAACTAAAAGEQPVEPPSGRGLARLFTVVAWMILGAGVTGAVLSWVTLTDVQAGLRGLGPDGLGSLPLGLLLGFAYLATGVLGFAFFWVSSLISTQLKDIRRLLLTLPAGRPVDESKTFGDAS